MNLKESIRFDVSQPFCFADFVRKACIFCSRSVMDSLSLWPALAPSQVGRRVEGSPESSC